MRNDDARNRGSVVSSDENELGGSPTGAINCRDTEETNTQRMMDMITSIKEANLRFSVEGTVREKKFFIVNGAGHGAIVGMCIYRGSLSVICRGEATDRENRLRRTEREGGHLDWDGNITIRA